MNRRKFLSLLSATGLATALPATAGIAAPTKDFSGHPDAVGVLHDSVRCIGCRKCEEACYTVNKETIEKASKSKKVHEPFDDLNVLNTKRRTTYDRFTVVNKYQPDSTGKVYFRKQQCNHCQEPACASACFVKAFVKTPEGPVIYKPNLCVGCRYCMVACPYFVPSYDYDSVLNPLVYKCTMCAPRIKEGKLPGCVESCPKDALLFGKRSDLLNIARKRIMDNPGLYTESIYGEREMGGTNWLYLSPVEHKELDQPELGKTTAPELTSGALGAVAMVTAIWPVLLGGAYAINKRRTKTADAEREAAVEDAIAKTQEEAATQLQKELAKAEKAKELSIKKAKEEAVKEYEEKLAADAAEKIAEPDVPEQAPTKEEE